jgi:serine/threonine protein kinase/Flp pilus assembly protein TadD
MSAANPRTESLFWSALALESPTERAHYLDQACGSDPLLRVQVEELLAAYPKVERFLESPAVPEGVTVDEPLTERPGTLIGPYKLMEQIGEGGMGLVFVAEQQQPVRRKVALKVIKPGMDSRQVIARFEAERQALALMDHPHIAKVHDGGTTDSGRPYFVMELVKGVPITDYCDQHRLTTRQRLEVFLPVCQAVQHAHQKGVIHRDLKPSNVLVAIHDVIPVVKVIDFGIAKATGPQQLTERTLYTGLAQLVGTPLYMSPEQAGQSSLDVDTRSDIYSLGVLLYELLTGTTPFESETLRQAGYDEMRRIIREEEPPRPSTRLSTLGQGDLATVCERRGVDAGKLGREVRGELDWIVMKALEKDRSRRYETASAFAADVQRYLKDEAVQACPPSAGYRVRKFALRNKGALATAGLILAALLAGTAVSAWQAVQATGARRLADERLANEMQARSQAQEEGRRAQAHFRQALDAVDRMLAHVADMKVVLPQMEEVRQGLLKDALELYTGLIALNPGDAGAYVGRGYIYRGLGRLDLAYADLEKAIELDPENPDAHATLGSFLIDYPGLLPQGPEPAVRDAREVGLAMLKRVVELQPTRPASHGDLGYAYVKVGQRKKAVDEFKKAAELLGPGSAEAVFYLAEVDRHAGNYRSALENAKKCLSLSPSDPWVGRRIAVVYHQIADLHYRLGEDEQFLAASLKSLELPGSSANTRAWTLFTRGKYYMRRKDYPAALSDFSRSIQLNPSFVDSYKRRAWLHFHFGRYQEALADIAKAVESNPEDLSSLTWISPELMASCPDEKFRAGILALADKAIERTRGKFGGYVARGQLYAGLKLYDKARADFDKAMELVEGGTTDADTLNEVAWLLATSSAAEFRDPKRAVALATKAVELAPKGRLIWNTLGAAHYRAGDWKAAIIWNTLGAAHYRAGDWRAAITALEKSMELGQGGDALDWFFLAMAHWQLGNKEQARTWHDKAVAWMDKHMPDNDELKRFRAEAAELLGVKDPPSRKEIAPSKP